MAKLTNKKLIEIAKRYKEIQVLQKQLKEEQDKLKEVLMNEMKDRDLNELMVDCYKVLYSKYDVTRFDSKRFAEEHKKMYENYMVTSTQERLLVNLGK